MSLSLPANLAMQHMKNSLPSSSVFFVFPPDLHLESWWVQVFAPG